MRILATGLRPAVVNTAMIIAVEKRTWRGLQDVVAILVNLQVFFNEIPRLHPQGSGQPLDVGLVKYRTGRLAAIGALQAVDFFEHGFVHFVKKVIHASRIFLLKTRQEFPVLTFLFL